MWQPPYAINEAATSLTQRSHDCHSYISSQLHASENFFSEMHLSLKMVSLLVVTLSVGLLTWTSFYIVSLDSSGNPL